LNPQGQQLSAALLRYDTQVQPLHGIHDPAALDCLVKQLLDAIRRVKFVERLPTTLPHPDCADPTSDRFDPLRAAVIKVRQGDHNEAIWLTFLAVHFGKHSKDSWTLARLVYGRHGEQGLWDWQSVSADPADFRRWLADQNGTLRQFRFSNHRQYESLAAYSSKGTGTIVHSFIDWIATAGSLDALVRATHQQVGQNPTAVFDALYKGMNQVQRFGRLGKFDFLTMLGKLGLAPIQPGSAYIWDGASGPYRGICLLATGNTAGALRRKQADQIYQDLGKALNLGMQELEDGLCNWQKNPTVYKYFRG
jgi:hypothetical protein